MLVPWMGTVQGVRQTPDIDRFEEAVNDCAYSLQPTAEGATSMRVSSVLEA